MSFRCPGQGSFILRQGPLLLKGVDPLAARQAAQAKAAAPAIPTFADAAALYIAAHESGWKNAVHRGQWPQTLATYAFPVIGKMPVDSITSNDVLRVLEPIWTRTPEAASRVRGRIEAVLSSAKARGWRSGENPAAWRDNLAHLLPPKGRVHVVRRHAALPWRDCPTFLQSLGERDQGMAARALAFTILTAARSGEARGATWDEIDLQAALWSLPAGRMKTGRPHRVPLSEPALDVLRPLLGLRQCALLFPGRDGASQLSDMAFNVVLKRMGRADLTAHGFRSSFRDWVADTGRAADAAEMALAHVTGNAVVQAYQRSDLLEARRGLMAEWAAFLTRPPAEVVALRAAG
jgi:integrase